MNEPVEQIVPLESWPTDPRKRWLCAGNAFGIHLMQARKDAIDRIPKGTSEKAREKIEAAIDSAICGVLSLFDGYLPTAIGDDSHAEYALLARYHRKGKKRPVEVIELAPDGDGLQMGFWGWVKNDFGIHSSPEQKSKK